MSRRIKAILWGALVGLGVPCLPTSVATAQDAVAASATETPSNSDPFDAWEKPRAVLFLTGRQHGYIEPCGCTGLANQKGGLARRATLLQGLRDRGWPVLALDAGNQVRRYGPQAEIKFRSTIEALRHMQYAAVGFGPDDLQLSIGELIAVAADAEGDAQVFVCANVNLLDFNRRFRVVEQGGVRFGITAVLGAEYAAQVLASEIEVQGAAEALPAVIEQMQKQGCHVMVLLAHATDAETKELAVRFPHFQLIVTSAGAGEPAREIQQVPEARGGIVQVGTKGMYAGVIGFYGAPEQLRVRYERVALDARYVDSPAMLQNLAAYQQQLKVLGLEGLGLRPVAHPSGHEFVGSASCAECHADAYEVWKGTPHAHATESIYQPTERSDIARHHDPECLSCHVTGWNPQEFFPYRSGYLGYEESPALHANGCENCHGPGSKHVAVESGDLQVTDDQQAILRKEMHAERKADRCMTCHDLDNSPDFHVEGAFEKYWKKIEHGH